MNFKIATFLISLGTVEAGLYSKADAPPIVDDLAAITYTRNIDPCLGQQGFHFIFEGDCSYEDVSENLGKYLPQSCAHRDGKTELEKLFGSEQKARESIENSCRQGWKNFAAKSTYPWSDVTGFGPKWDKEFYDGHGSWNEEYQTRDDSVFTDRPANVLKEDARHIKELYDAEGQRMPIEFPSHLQNFESCDLRSVMCCWPSDRQPNDGNGNCNEVSPIWRIISRCHRKEGLVIVAFHFTKLNGDVFNI